MSEIWFEVWMEKIRPVQVEKYTEASVWVDGQRRSRLSWRSYFPTWVDAHKHLLSKFEAELESARIRLQVAQGRHGQIKGMKPPETP